MQIELKNISKNFEKEQVLKNINMVFCAPITCIMGPSGIGKTTIANIISRIEKPDEGEVLGIEGKKIGMVFQEDRLCDNINAIKNIQLVCEKTEEAIKKELEEIGLTEESTKKVIEYSGGMKRRVCIVRAFLFEPDIIIMDEPFKGLDEKTKIQTIEYIKKRTDKKTLIIITHDKEDADLLGAEVKYIQKRIG